MTKKKGTEAVKPSSLYKINGRTAASTIWDGNDYITQVNLSDGERQSMDILDSAIPLAYKSATDGANAADYAQRYYENQVKQVNKDMTPQLTALKDSLITGGQVGSSTGWNKIKAFTDSYADTIADLAANKENNALNYKNNLLAYANGLQGAMNGYYDLSNSLAQFSANNQQNAANQNLEYTKYNNSLNQSNNTGWLNAALGAAGTAAGAYFGGGALGAKLGSSLGNSLANLASNTGGKK